MEPALEQALQAADEAGVRQELTRFLLDLLRVDTTAGPALERVRANEQRAFEVIARQIERIRGSRDELEFVPIDPCIASDAYYTATHYTRTPEQPAGLNAAQTYRGRSNLVLRLPGQGQGVLAFNAHVDVVAPYIPPRFADGVFHGRGACDDKGQCAVLVLALALIERARREGLVPPADLLLEFVIDEEPGGNGSLSLALDRRFAFDALVVFEPTSLAIHPGNRGAVWYKIELDAAAAPGVDLVALAADIVWELEREGAAIKDESDHPLFPHRPVQTCHGILGPWGEHPSAVNDHVELAIAFAAPPDAKKLRELVDEAVEAYVIAYGDKTKEPDPETGRPKVARHVDLAIEGTLARLVVHGKAGHMGATAQCDNAITKAAFVIRLLSGVLGDAIRRFSVEAPPPQEPASSLVLEGGQGFLPTHSLAEVTERMTHAAQRAAQEHCHQRGLGCSPRLLAVSFDKLHNDAFARDADGPAVQALVASARAVGIEVHEPLRGWDVSCDARLFAREYADSEVITFGPGALAHAHAADEQVRLDDVAAAAKALAHFALTYTPKH